MIQRLVVDLVVLVAAGWLVWTFSPAGPRAALARLLPRRIRPATAAAPLAAGGVEGLKAEELAGEGAPSTPCGPSCGCG